MVIYIDYREPEKIEKLLRSEGLPVQREDLQFFDYLVSVRNHEIPVERKEVNDFVASIEDGRIFNQAHVMSTVSEISFIVVEGSPMLALAERKFPRAAFIGALSSLVLKRSPYGKKGWISIVVLDTVYDTVLFLKHLHRQIEEGNLHRLPVNRVRKTMIDKRTVVVAMLQAIPGIGPETAYRIAERYPSISHLIKADVRELASIPGVGPVRARRIKEYLG